MGPYLERSDPAGPATARERWTASGLAVAGATFMLFIAVYASKVTHGWIGAVGKIPLAAPMMFILASSFLLQRETAAEAAKPPIEPARHRRLYAAFFYALGIALIAMPFVHI